MFDFQPSIYTGCPYVEQDRIKPGRWKGKQLEGHVPKKTPSHNKGVPSNVSADCVFGYDKANPNGRSLHLGPPSQGAPYTVFIGSGGMSSMDKVRPIAHSLPYSSLLLDLQPLHGRGALRHLLHMCGCTVVGGRP